MYIIQKEDIEKTMRKFNFLRSQKLKIVIKLTIVKYFFIICFYFNSVILISIFKIDRKQSH